MKIYVSKESRGGDGTKDYPLSSLAQAAAIAGPGDEVIVAPGIYREYVNPACAGTPEKRITYRSEVKYGAVITGAEEVKNWERYKGSVWKARIPNGIFGAYNPYTVKIFGDWYDAVKPMHTGEVYINNKALYETDTLEEVLNPTEYRGSWDPGASLYKWYAAQENNETVIYANFREWNPNRENVEINVRRNCFYPSREGIGYITLSGFTITKAATQWAPPTAYQEGMIGPHWSKGWIIEDCDISHSRCSGISLGKYLQPENDNKWAVKHTKTGTQTERDAICQAQREGWTKEAIGSHIIRRCNIHDCGQTGIVGHLGGVFSIIEDNNIHHINNKQDLAGAEIGGIKMHAAIDVIIRRNKFHHCTRGLWLDWQAQGTRVTQNIFYKNTPPDGTEFTEHLSVAEDLFIEVSHGPTLIDNNLFLSEVAGRLCTQGIAFVHNLIAGSFVYVGNGTDNGSKVFPSPRYTPYHVPHRTEISGFMTILHGDARFFNNIFIQQSVRKLLTDYAKDRNIDRLDLMNYIAGTKPYDGYPDAGEYFAKFQENNYKIREERDKYYDHLPVYSGGNLYFNGAQPYDGESNYTKDTENHIDLKLVEKDDKVILFTNLYQYIPNTVNEMISTELLGEAFEPEELFENPDGSPITFDTDYLGKHRRTTPVSGPFELYDKVTSIQL
ncbi:right-handed parallel beta-helix repeat-containing protein [Eisenbergiella porci]|uniref:right-handed parallel beta-helix repeat-containing protein n=1 Tax=Eisenbergiella porci TaxID=2652274 RepID=UPI002A83F8A6|nr:right-handed parallel beta-helix repeat-containing protein [Eisenbergiella porci]